LTVFEKYVVYNAQCPNRLQNVIYLATEKIISNYLGEFSNGGPKLPVAAECLIRFSGRIQEYGVSWHLSRKK
jgi:hypothetical protein